MPKTKSKRKTESNASDDKIKTLNRVRRSTARKALPLKPVTKPAAHQQPVRRESKKSRIIAMLRAPGGVTIEAMARAAKWQPHSVRGFLAGVIRKTLGFHVVSEPSESGRIYRITERTASTAVAATG